MITPSEIKQKAENKYIAYLQSIVEGIPFNPITIAGNKRPDDNTVKLEAELTELINHSKEKKGFGYSIEYSTVKTKLHGVQDLPSSIVFQSESDYLRFIGKEKVTAKFKEDIARIIESFPELKDWIYKYPRKVIENDWDSLLKVCAYFKRTPQPNLYIRELPIKVHTKFIENNKGIIKELLDILIADYVDQDEKHFESRFHLKYDEPIVRFRILDNSISHLSFSDVEDISIPISQFKQLVLPVQKVYVVENKINMLSFPMVEKSIVIWGHGFGVETICNVDWLKDKDIFYWGDLDAQGFQILSLLRSHFEQVKSFMMDRVTFDNFYEGDKGTKTNIEKGLCLTSEENDMFLYLKLNNLRLEQEKIPYEYTLRKIPIIN
jgi:hypothetical protein